MRKRYKAFLLVLICFCFVGCAGSQPTFQDSQGHLWHLSDFQGKWLVLNYWASWCHACRQEIPALNAFYKKHQHNKKVQLVAVNYDGASLAQLEKMARAFNIHYPLLVKNPAKHFHLGAIPALPVTFIINPAGKVVKKLFGPHQSVTLNKIVETTMSASQA